MTSQVQKDLLLKIQGLKVSLEQRGKRKYVIHGVDLELGKGEALCLVGESGCGKTMTALSIMGLLPKQAKPKAEGRVYFKGQDILGIDPFTLRKIRGKGISMVFQEPLSSLNPVLSIGAQLAELFYAHTQLSKEEVLRECEKVLKEVGLEDNQRILKAYPHMLSGGQRQRVMIAMAVALKPDLLIADEPTTALDVTIQAQILGLLSRLRKDFGLSLLFITHDLHLVPQVGDLAAIMYAGHVVEKGPSEELLKNPLHPYTRVLLGSVPSKDTRGKKLPIIPGAPPDDISHLWGCRFYPRCPQRKEMCEFTPPEIIEVGSNRCVRCLLYG